MGLIVVEDGNRQGLCLEIRRESVKLIPPENTEDKPYCSYNENSGWYVELSKAYLKRLVAYFSEHPERLE